MVLGVEELRRIYGVGLHPTYNSDFTLTLTLSPQGRGDLSYRTGCGIARAWSAIFVSPHPKPVLDLLHAPRVSHLWLRHSMLNLLAIRTTYTSSVRKSAPLPGRENQLLQLLIPSKLLNQKCNTISIKLRNPRNRCVNPINTQEGTKKSKYCNLSLKAAQKVKSEGDNRLKRCSKGELGISRQNWQNIK